MYYNSLSFLICTYKLLLLFQVTGVCCPDSQTEKTSFGDEAVLENNEARSSSASKEKVSEKSPRKTACLLSDSQKQKIRNSQCIRSNVKRDSVEQSDDFIAKQLLYRHRDIVLGHSQCPMKRYQSECSLRSFCM